MLSEFRDTSQKMQNMPKCAEYLPNRVQHFQKFLKSLLRKSFIFKRGIMHSPPVVLPREAPEQRAGPAPARRVQLRGGHRELDGALVREGLLDVRLGCKKGFARS